MSETADDLRQYYITPTYLEVMRNRARYWSEDFIQAQLSQFRHTIPDYPEVLELLEGEIHRRRLNTLKARIRRLKNPELEAMKEQQSDPDAREVIETEILIRQGTRRLPDSEENARIQ
ncbi:MAG: hypothetical protein KDK25_03410 [Leptospiraceae bacterium]|nr:hypothetical protein [Leptospiraceae bacterium]